MPSKKEKSVRTVDEDSEEESIDFDKKKIDELFKNYDGGDGRDREKFLRFFEDGENNDCLICIRQMKSKDKIWSCSKCYCPFHLLCIQKWANDSTIQKKLFQENQPQGYYTNTGEYVTKKQIAINWDCPQCRSTYELNEIPRNYVCYCGKERDPPVQSFIIPHSCGEICNQKLTDCNHTCKLLCHPRACPPCPIVIQTSCLCKKSDLKSIRCSQGWWVCAQKCQKSLECGHKCENTCHDECPPCPKSSTVKCACGKSSKNVKCADSKWFCENRCGKLFSCQKHECDEVCHKGSCGECPYRSNQSCFCGKQSYMSSDCDKLIRESCGNTCLKTLACGHHNCMERCHKGDCGNCLENVKKKCRCGAIERDLVCSKDLLCETKCKNIKNCKKHYCNRKCCVECVQCDKICGKSLKCGKHKCGALCHDGECYPCNEKLTIKCRCTSTKILVKCGKKNIKTPNCRQSCKFNTKKCHHDPIPHKCHQGDCPVCTQICDEILPCNHKCAAKCHDNVKTITKDKNYVPKMPGEFAEVKIEILKLEHPPCKINVNLECLGGHVNNEFQCYEAKVMSCGRKCGRELRCGNHKCLLDCHPVKGEQDECQDCDQPCSLVRPGNCTHPCPRGICHPSSVSCKKCTVVIKDKCFCGLTDIFYRCCDVNKKNMTLLEVEELREKNLKCGLKCIKTYPCGHQCQSNECHKGKCPGAEECSRKVKLTCVCKMRKVEFICKKVRDEKIVSVECDEKCKAAKEKLEHEKLEQKLKMKELEEEKNRKELEEYEKKLGKKKYKERKQRQVSEEKSSGMMKIYIGVGISIAILASILYYFMNSQ